MTALGDFSAGDVLTAADLNAIGTWSDFTPNIRAGSGAYSSVTVLSAKYAQINETVVGFLNYKINNVGTGSGDLIFDLPVNDADFTSTISGAGIGAGRENQLNGYTLNCLRLSATTAAIKYYNNAGITTTGTGGGVMFVYRGT